MFKNRRVNFLQKTGVEIFQFFMQKSSKTQKSRTFRGCFFVVLRLFGWRLFGKPHHRTPHETENRKNKNYFSTYRAHHI